MKIIKLCYLPLWVLYIIVCFIIFTFLSFAIGSSWNQYKKDFKSLIKTVKNEFNDRFKF